MTTALATTPAPAPADLPAAQTGRAWSAGVASSLALPRRHDQGQGSGYDKAERRPATTSCRLWTPSNTPAAATINAKASQDHDRVPELATRERDHPQHPERQRRVVRRQRDDAAGTVRGRQQPDARSRLRGQHLGGFTHAVGQDHAECVSVGAHSKEGNV